MTTISDGPDRPGQNNQSCTINQAPTDSTSHAEPPNQLPLVPPLLDARHMPDVNSPFAPCFDGQPHSLALYLHDIELLGRNGRLTSEELIWYSIYYLDSEEAEKWKAHALNIELEGGHWGNFRAGIMLLYPGSDDYDPYAATQLEALVRDYAAVPMRNLLQYDEYYDQFTIIADRLLDKGSISQRRCSELFLAGFHVNIRDPLKFYLDQSHTPSELLTVTEIDRTARYVLQWNSAPTPEVAFSAVNPQFNTQPSYTYPLPSKPFQSTPLIQSDQSAQRSWRSALMTPAPRESLDMESLKHFLTSDAFLNKVVDKLAAKLAPASAVPLQAHLSQLNQPRYTRPANKCRACSDPTHFIRYCPKVVDYVLRGHCVKDQNNRICLPNGTLVTTRLAPGKDILERVDNWYRAHPAASFI